MPYYLVNRNAQPTGEHEVHENTCGHLPDVPNRANLGSYTNCREAIAAARAKGYANVDGCFYCCNACHTR